MIRIAESRMARFLVPAFLFVMFACCSPAQGLAAETTAETGSQAAVLPAGVTESPDAPSTVTGCDAGEIPAAQEVGKPDAAAEPAGEALADEVESQAAASALDQPNMVSEEAEAQAAATPKAPAAQEAASQAAIDQGPADKAPVAQDLITQATVRSTAIADGVYTIVSALSDAKCLDVPWGSGDNSVQMQIYNRKETPAQRWSIRGLGDGTYEIVNVGSGKALDVADADASAGAVVQQYERNATAGQKWAFVPTDTGCYKIVSALSDALALDVAWGSSENGTAVQLWRGKDTKAQQWSLVSAEAVESGFYVLENVKSGKALDVADASLNNGGNIQQYRANGTPGQTFQLAYDSSNGYYTITNLGSGKVLDVVDGSSAAGTNVQQFKPNGSRAQQWAAVKGADGSVTFRSAVSGMALDVADASASNGANVQVWPSNGSKAQKWSLSGVSSWLPEGSYAVIATISPGNVLDVVDGSTKNGANVQMHASTRTNAQKFYFRPVGGGCYTIQNPISGKYLNVTKKSSGGNVVLGAEQQQFKLVFKAGGITIKLKEDASVVLDIVDASTRSGANVQVHKWNGSDAQRFVVKPMDIFADGSYAIRYAANAGFTADVPDASSVEGVQLQLYEDNGTAAQRFGFKRVSYNTYQITAACSGRALAVVKAGGSYQLQQRTAANSDDQQWVVSLDADGAVQFAPKSNGGLRIDLSDGIVANGTPLIVRTSNGATAQQWKLVPASDSAAYDTVNLTLRRMAELQKAEYGDLSIQELMDLLDPSKLDKAQFLDLRETTGLTAEQLNAFIVSTDTGWSGVLKGLGSSFVAAAEQQGLNEAYLLAHAILESGWGTSTLARGYVYEGGEIDGKYYEAGTYYNFYGIGAYDSSPLSGGRKLAIINGWNSPEKAVTGAAKWIAENYVYAKSHAQPTLYAMKWDYARANATGERGWHQYATSTSWPDSIASLIRQCYASAGAAMPQAFIIPKYQ